MSQLPTTWLGVLAVLIVTIPGTLAGLGAMRASRRNRNKLGDVQNTIDNVNEQVSNGHSTNLRDDVTRLIAQGVENARMTSIVKKYVETQMPDSNALLKVHEAINGISDDVRHLRDEIGEERQARTELDERVRRHHEQHKPPTGE
jgi:hypothetical protein